jgi:hypothetical protein
MVPKNPAVREPMSLVGGTSLEAAAGFLVVGTVSTAGVCPPAKNGPRTDDASS